MVKELEIEKRAELLLLEDPDLFQIFRLTDKISIYVHE